jgi:hypothetical protein
LVSSAYSWAAMRHLNIAIVCSALLFGCSSVRNAEVAQPHSKTVDLYYGTVELPNNFIHFRGQGIDSVVGDFTRTDGRFRIEYDIGAMAGVITSQPIENVVSSNSVTVGNLNAIIVVSRSGRTRLAMVSFPDPMVNFFADIADDSELEVLKKLVSTYKSKP